jgi:predicted SAM-dependent methyltransferase
LERIKIGKESDKKVKLHLGCGKRFIPGFFHIDVANYAHIDSVREISDLSIFENESVDLIYCSHALEYFDRYEAVKVLSEWHRVLRKGGTLRIAVPDFEALVEVYCAFKNLDLIKGPLYGRLTIDTLEGQRVIYHKTCYDFESLKRLLEKSGFMNVQRYDWRKTEHKDVDDYSQAYIPHMDKKKGKLISLNIEAKKP